MNQHKTVVIIGAGIGGITTALFLAKSGYSVSVYEKNPSPGGRCGQITRDGHRFDIGATIVLMPSIYRMVFKSLGLDFDECFTRCPISTLYKIYYEDGTELEFSSDDKDMHDQLEQIEEGSYNKARLYIQKGYKFFILAIDKLLGRNFTRLSEFVTLENVLLLIKLKTYLRHKNYVKKFFRHPHLRTAFTFQNIYVGQNPLKAPALFAMIPAAELTEGSFFPEGGLFSITEKLFSIAESMGVMFFFNTPVEKIVVSGNHANGIEINGGSPVNASVVVANADLPYVYRELLPDAKRSRRIEQMKYSCSAIVMHWGLDKKYSMLSHHNVFLSSHYRSNLRIVFNKQSLSENPSFYVHAPVRSDLTAAPPGKDTLSVIIPSGHLGNRNQNDWNKLKNIARSAVLRRLKQLGLTDIESHIEFEICYLPQTWKTAFNLSRGSTFGSLAHNIFQMGYFRPHNRHPRYSNLYFVGGSTHPGNGIPLVLLSAKLTSERILKELENA